MDETEFSQLKSKLKLPRKKIVSIYLLKIHISIQQKIKVNDDGKYLPQI